MDWASVLTAAATIITAMGGLELIKFLLNRKTIKKIDEANAFKIQRDALMEDYKRVQKEVDDLNAKVEELYKRLHKLENERLDLINENNALKLALKETEKHICMQPDDKCLRRLNDNVKCRLVGLLRGSYTEDHQDAILTEEDMLKQEEQK